MQPKPIIIKTTPAFDKRAVKTMTSEAQLELYVHLADHPDSGDIIAGTGGVRKIRWRTGKNNKGKSGGVRILYYYAENILVLLISLYEKSKQENITQAEKNDLKLEIPPLVKEFLETLK